MEKIIALSNKKITLERNEFLNESGSIDTNIYFIEKGSLKIFVLDNEEEQIIRLGYKKNIVACLDAFLSNRPTVFHVQAIKKTVLRVIEKRQIDHFLANQKNNSIWTKVLEDLIMQQLERELDLLTTSPLQRYKRVLKRSPQLFQEIPHRYIANYLRMSPETLSRMKSVDLNQDLLN